MTLMFIRILSIVEGKLNDITNIIIYLSIERKGEIKKYKKRRNKISKTILVSELVP